MIHVLRSWKGGPLREFADVRPTPNWGTNYSGFMPFANRYVCEECKASVNGVYSVKQIDNLTLATLNLKWLCSDCKAAHNPKPQPKQLRRE